MRDGLPVTEEPSPQEIASKILFKGWGVHYTRQVLLMVLVNEPDGISWPDGLAPKMAAADPNDLLARFSQLFDQPQMIEEFKLWLTAAHVIWGMPLLEEFQ